MNAMKSGELFAGVGGLGIAVDAVIVARPGRYGTPFSAGVLSREHAVAEFLMAVAR